IGRFAENLAKPNGKLCFSSFAKSRNRHGYRASKSRFGLVGKYGRRRQSRGLHRRHGGGFARFGGLYFRIYAAYANPSAKCGVLCPRRGRGVAFAADFEFEKIERCTAFQNHHARSGGFGKKIQRFFERGTRRWARSGRIY